MQKLWVAVAVMVYLFVVPFTVSAAGLVPCGGPNEQPCQTCHVVSLVNNVVAWLVMILGTIAAILIIVAGVRLVTSGGNTSAMEQAKSSMTNLIIGYLIVLSAWLVLDYGLKALLIQDGANSFGVWNTISCVDQPDPKFNAVTQDVVRYLPLEPGLGGLPGWKFVGGGIPGGTGGGGSDSGQSGGGTPGTYNSPCLKTTGPAGASIYNCATQQAQCTAANGIPTLNSTRSVVICTPRQVVVGGGTGGPLPQCTNRYCSVSALMAAGMTQRQANVMSCIAITESSGNPNTPPYNVTNPGSNSSACGLFQIVRTTWNLYNPGGSCSNHASNCQNAYCNSKVAVTIVRQNGFNDWLCPNCNKKAKLCVQKYGG